MRSVAFLRNLNHGQRNSPTGSALVGAFEQAGATGVATFQSNGTVLFEADDPDGCATDVAALLAAGSGWSDALFVRSSGWVCERVTTIRPTLAVDPRLVELSLFDDSATDFGPTPTTGRRCTVVEVGAGFAVTVNERPDESNATPTIERALGTPVTSRGLPTLLRLASRLDGA